MIESGEVVDSRVELGSELPERAAATVLVREGDETFEALCRSEILALWHTSRHSLPPIESLNSEMDAKPHLRSAS